MFSLLLHYFIDVLRCQNIACEQALSQKQKGKSVLRLPRSVLPAMAKNYEFQKFQIYCFHTKSH